MRYKFNENKDMGEVCMKNREKTIWITRTAAFIALLVVLQAVTAPLGNTIVTGTLVNAVLIVSVMTGGVMAGALVGGVSPFMAKLVGIGPLWSLIPFIALGNITLILVWHFVGNGQGRNRLLPEAAAVLAGAGAKFLVLYLGIVRLAVPVLLKLPQPQASVVSAMFSVPQLITALLGGVAALPVLGALRKAHIR